MCIARACIRTVMAANALHAVDSFRAHSLCLLGTLTAECIHDTALLQVYHRQTQIQTLKDPTSRQTVNLPAPEKRSKAQQQQRTQNFQQN
jgi:hypothetical protein